MSIFRSFLVSVCLIGASACGAPDQEAVNRAMQAAVEDTVLDLTDELARAISDRNAKRIAGMFAQSRYTKYVSDGVVIPLDSIETVLARFYGGLDSLSFSWYRKEAEVIGAEAVAVTSWTTYTAIPRGGAPITEAAVFTNLFIRTETGWKLLSSHKSFQES
ncbi:MAG: nuclear transport factor 2 family protein [Longimicrobiales bacterium]